VSLDDTTRASTGWSPITMRSRIPANPNSGYQIDPNNTGPKGGPVVRLGYMPALSTNKSVLGYRGSHKIAGSDVDFHLPDRDAAGDHLRPRPQYFAVPTVECHQGWYRVWATPSWASPATTGESKIGTTYSPYKKATDRMNPFSGMLGDYSVVMGNSGGDNRVEFGTRLDHSIWYESPNSAMCSASMP